MTSKGHHLRQLRTLGSAGIEAQRSLSHAITPRAWALGLAILLHLALLALLIAAGASRIVRQVSEPKVVTLSLPGVNDAGGAAESLPVPAHPIPPPEPRAFPMPVPPTPILPPPPLVPPPPVDAPAEPADTPILQPQFDAEPDPSLTGDAPATMVAGTAGSANGAGADCPLETMLGAALQADPVARVALARIPRPSRSVANAVMMWDGRWVADARVGGPPAINAVRGAIAAVLRAAPPGCADRVVLGPVFVPVNVFAPTRGDTGTIVLALGSGAWRWPDMLRTGMPLESGNVR